MKFQFTNTTLGSKKILLDTINKNLTDPIFKESLQLKINSTPLLKDDKILNRDIVQGELGLDSIEKLKNNLMLPILANTKQLGKDKSEMTIREILQALGDELRKVNKRIFLGFLAVDLLDENKARKERMDLKCFIGGAGTGKDTLSKYCFDSITDTRTVMEIRFVTEFNSCITYNDQISFLCSFINDLDLNKVIEEGFENKFEKTIYENINKSISKFNKLKTKQSNKYKTDYSKKGLVTFLSRPILEEQEYKSNDYKEYIEELQKVYEENGIDFTKTNKDIFGFIRKGVNVHHYTEKLNQIIRIYRNSQGKTEKSIQKELDFVLSYGDLTPLQKEEFEDYFRELSANPTQLEMVENKYLKETTDKMIVSMFKNAINSTKNKFKSTELITDSLDLDPEKVITSTNIYFDFDDVIVDFIPAWIDSVNEKLGSNYTMKDVEYYWWFDSLAQDLLSEGKTTEEVDEVIWDFLRSDVYQNIDKHSNIINIMKTLKTMGFNVKVLSAMGSESKETFIKDNLTFINYRTDLIITGDKAIVQPGILVDDGGHNTEAMVESNNMTYCILIDTKYNKNIETGGRITRVSLQETTEIMNLIIAKAYSSEARKRSLPLIIEDLGIEITESMREILKGKNIEDLVSIFKESEKND